MRVTLARALKEKKRVAGRINTLEQFVKSNNIYEEENKELPSYKVEKKRDVLEKLEELSRLRKRIIDIKEAIAKANVENGICGLVYNMEERKSEISFYKEINANTRPCSFESNGVAIFIERVAQVTKESIDSKVEELTKEIEELQDKIDEINASSLVDIPDSEK